MRFRSLRRPEETAHQDGNLCSEDQECGKQIHEPLVTSLEAYDDAKTRLSTLSLFANQSKGEGSFDIVSLTKKMSATVEINLVKLRKKKDLKRARLKN